MAAAAGVVALPHQAHRHALVLRPQAGEQEPGLGGFQIADPAQVRQDIGEQAGGEKNTTVDDTTVDNTVRRHAGLLWAGSVGLVRGRGRQAGSSRRSHRASLIGRPVMFSTHSHCALGLTSRKT